MTCVFYLLSNSITKSSKSNKNLENLLKMGKRKSIVKNRLKWMNDAKKSRVMEMEQEAVVVEEDEEQQVVEGEIVEESLQHVHGDGQVEDEEENQQVWNEEMEDETVYEIEELAEDGIPPSLIYIDGVAIPTHDLPDPRNGDGMVLELDREDAEPYLAQFNGDYHDLHQIVGAVWEDRNGEAQITIGRTTMSPRSWALNAYRVGKKFVKRPTLRTAACRCVITAIRAFSFKVYIRTHLLAEKVKGLIRGATECIRKGQAVDDTDALVVFHRYIERKMFNSIEHLPPSNQAAVMGYLRGKGWSVDIA